MGGCRASKLETTESESRMANEFISHNLQLWRHLLNPPNPDSLLVCSIHPVIQALCNSPNHKLSTSVVWAQPHRANQIFLRCVWCCSVFLLVETMLQKKQGLAAVRISHNAPAHCGTSNGWAAILGCSEPTKVQFGRQFEMSNDSWLISRYLLFIH